MTRTSAATFDPKRARRLGVVFALAVYVVGWAMLRLQAQGVIATQPNWPLLADFFLTVPLAYVWFNRRAGKQAWLGALAMCGVGVLVARQLMPQEPLLQPFAVLRYVAMGVAGALELGAIVGLLLVVRRLGAVENAESALYGAIAARMGNQPVVRFVQFEARMWLYCLAPSRWSWRFTGEHHYSYHAKDANASTQLGYIYLILFSVPIDHLLLHLWSPIAAWIVTLATLYGTVFLVAHYRAIHRRPISLDAQTLWLRNGLFGDMDLPTSAIATAGMHRGNVARAPGLLRFGADAYPNVRLQLREPREVAGPWGRKLVVDSLYFSVDQPQRLLADLRACLGTA